MAAAPTGPSTEGCLWVPYFRGARDCGQPLPEVVRVVTWCRSHYLRPLARHSATSKAPSMDPQRPTPTTRCSSTTFSSSSTPQIPGARVRQRLGPQARQRLPRGSLALSDLTASLTLSVGEGRKEKCGPSLARVIFLGSCVFSKPESSVRDSISHTRDTGRVGCTVWGHLEGAVDTVGQGVLRFQNTTLKASFLSVRVTAADFLLLNKARCGPRSPPASRVSLVPPSRRHMASSR